MKCAQAFRAHVLDMFEPQDHPNDFAYPGAPPTPPYDMAGWTLAYQMGVKFDRILDGFDGPFEELKDEVPPPPAQGVRRRERRRLLPAHADERLIPRGESAARGRRGSAPVAGAVHGRGRSSPAGDVLHPEEGRHAGAPGKDRGTSSARASSAAPVAPGKEAVHAQAGAHRPVGSLRRLDALRLDALAARAIRVPVPGRLPAGTGQGRTCARSSTC